MFMTWKGLIRGIWETDGLGEKSTTCLDVRIQKEANLLVRGCYLLDFHDQE
jgi:hypothetical protein